MDDSVCNIDFLPYTQLVKAPATAVAKPVAAGKVPAQAEAAGGADGGIDDDLQARLDNLRKM